MKKIICIILACAVVLGMTGVYADAAASGSCGANITWRIDGTTLYIEGTGAMNNYTDGGTPWNSVKDSITSVIVSDGVTAIGDLGFRKNA